jgi:hypothetical protein
MSRRLTLVLLLAACLAVTAVPAFAAKGGKPRTQPYAATLVATPDVLRAGDYFTVSGCNYDTALGNVLVSFTGGSWGSPLDASGCFMIANIPALSGDTLPIGTYKVIASQLLGKRWTEMGSTTVTVVNQ